MIALLIRLNLPWYWFWPSEVIFKARTDPPHCSVHVINFILNMSMSQLGPPSMSCLYSWNFATFCTSSLSLSVQLLSILPLERVWHVVLLLFLYNRLTCSPILVLPVHWKCVSVISLLEGRVSVDLLLEQGYPSTFNIGFNNSSNQTYELKLRTMTQLIIFIPGI